MRRLIPLVIIIFTLVFTGCTSKSTGIKESADKAGNSVNEPVSSLQNQGSSNTSTSQRIEVPNDFKPIKPGTVPQLSSNQKSEVNTKVNSVLNSIDSALKSLQDPQDIDMTSVN